MATRNELTSSDRVALCSLIETLSRLVQAEQEDKARRDEAGFRHRRWTGSAAGVQLANLGWIWSRDGERLQRLHSQLSTE